MADAIAVESGARDDGLKQSGFDPRSVLPDITQFYNVSNFTAARNVAWQWIIIACAAAFAIGTGHWAAYVVAGLVIATRQHALAVIMHDGAHYRLFTNRTANEWLGDFLCAFPVGLAQPLYRRTHLLHHRFTSTDKDPDYMAMQEDADWHWPKPMWDTAKLFFMDIVGLKAIALLKIFRWWSPWPRLSELGKRDAILTPVEQLRFVIYVVALLTLLAVTGGWWNYLFLWLLPSVSFLSALFRLRGVAEHLCLPADHELNSTRHVVGTWLERASIAPLNINYHLAHHMFPAVPLYNLPQVMDRLMQDPVFRKGAAITQTYTGLKNGVLAEIVTELRQKREAARAQQQAAAISSATAGSV